LVAAPTPSLPDRWRGLFGEQFAKVDGEDVGVDEVERAEGGGFFGERCQNARVVFDRRHGAGLSQERQGERAEAGADFEDGFARFGVDDGEQAGDDGFVAQEVLAEVFGGFDFVHRMSM